METYPPPLYEPSISLGDVKGGAWAPLSANLAFAPLDWGRTSECIHGSSKNLGVYSRIERHGDRQTTGDWQFEEIWRLGRQISSNCQSPMLCLSRGVGPTECKPRIWHR